MHVYRLEDPEGRGIYRVMMPRTARHRPPPQQDYMDDYSEDHYFAFVSLDQMLQWFDHEGEVESMQKWKVEVSEYDVDADDVIVGEHQCAFIRDKATLVDRYSYEGVFYADRTARQVA